MAFSSSLGPDVTMALQATQIVIAPAAGWPSDSNMAPGGSPDPRHPHSLQW